MEDIDSWLKRSGLEKYIDIFQENDIALDVVEEIEDADLQAFGFSFGDRKRFVRAVRQLAEEVALRTDETTRLQPEPVAKAPGIAEAERRHLTVMFCDLVGSTSLSQTRDPEDYRNLLSVFQSAITKAIVSNGGFVARYMGDGALAYFGYPAASENDPEMAVRAGLETVAAVDLIESAEPLQVRVGIATGQVVVGDIIGEGASAEAAALGETPNLAARLQAAARPNTVYIAESTQSLLGDRIETQALAPVALKGLEGRVTPYLVVRLRSVAEVSERRRDPYPLVGRDVELALLDRAWQNACSGQGQVVILTGEPGVGKSRLVRAFRDSLSSGTTQSSWYCSPYHVSTANYPFLDQLQRLLQRPQLDNYSDFERLSRFLQGLGIPSAEAAFLLARVAGIPLPDGWEPPELPPDEIRRRTQQLQVDLLRATAAKGPTVLIVEDVHWIDPTSSGVLGQMVDELGDDSVLLLLTARPEYDCPWTNYSHVAEHLISHLSRADTLTLVQSIIEDRGIATELSQHVLERTDGVPLYVEELTKALLESAEEAGVPASLQDSLMARLDRLGPIKEIAQIAAVIGRDFSLESLTALTDLNREAVESGLDALCESGLVHRRHGQSGSAGSAYEFKHALVRDAAYESLLRERRRSLHAQFAHTLDGAASAELVAFHLTEAQDWLPAANNWRQAGDAAARRSALLEAVEHFRNALACLEFVDSDQELLALHCSIELAFAFRNLGQPDDVIVTLGNCKAVLARSGTPLDHARAHYLRGVAHFVLGDVKRTFEEETEALAAARDAGSAELESRALSSLGDWAYASRRVHSAFDYQQQCAELARRHSLTIVAIDNATCLESTQRHIQGTADPSYVLDAIDQAVTANLPRAEAILCAGAAWTFAHRDELDRSLEFAERGVHVASSIGSTLWRSYNLAAQSRTAALLGDRREARRLAKECASVARSLGSAIIGGLSFGALALSANNVVELEAALSEGEAGLSDGDTAHCHVDFRRDAIDACLGHGQWDAALHHAEALRSFCELEPLRPAAFLVARGEMLARLGGGESSQALRAQVLHLIQEGEALGARYFVRALSAVAEVG